MGCVVTVAGQLCKDCIFCGAVVILIIIQCVEIIVEHWNPIAKHLCYVEHQFAITEQLMRLLCNSKQTLALRQASEESACFLLSFFCND